ncbi:MAG TPA: N-acetyl-alpha-D-glucosaminyl L-malate synthase BshA [Bacteroidia bacterium]|nr:N-acetyl-alpha-D-glucosaminyl L-malate synthase BshA [Bacteroidia bacterium]HNT80977.1 N-acetyl-alpha-D-glucosaminyl L-malate synthase BshA [Bacteroidia bacterium]
MKQLNIGIVCYPTFGGSGVLATELGKALAEKGHKVHFITYNQPVRLDAFSENIWYHEVGIPNYPLFEYAPYESALTSKLVDIALHENLDVMHVHYAIPHASAAIFAQQILREHKKYIPVITTLHGTDITLVGKDQSYKPIVNFAINKSDGVTTVSESLKQDTLNNFEITRPIQVIHNFVDLKRFNKQCKDHFRKAIAPHGEKLVVHTSNFRPVKRVQDVVHTFCKIQREIPAKLLFIGDGPERSAIENLCRELNCIDNTRFLGKQEAIEEILSVSDLFLLPSESESFGLAALEAMACQLPVIASNAGGIPEVVDHGVNGFLHEVGDVKGMAESGLLLLRDPEKLLSFKNAALKKAKQFDIHNIVPLYEKFYCSIIEQCQEQEVLN